MAVAYQVVVKDHAGARTAVIMDWLSLNYANRVNGLGSHQIVLSGGSPAVPAFLTDAQVEVWRSDPEANIPWYLDYEGFHRTPVQATDSTNRQTFTSYGRGYNDLLTRRTILYPAGDAGSDKSGPGETVMKAYVDENAGPSATVPPRLYDGVTPGLSVAPDNATGAAWTGSRAWRNLLDVCQEIALATGVDFAVVGSGPATWDFIAKPYPLGTDRSTAGLDPVTGLNAAGNAPVVFALGFGNMTEPSYSVSRTDEVNAVIALGQGTGALRTTVESTDPIAIAVSPWNRREATRQGNQESTLAGLTSVADALLMELGARTTFAFRVLQSVGVRYGRDYFVGDVCEAQYLGQSFSFQIVGASVSFTRGVETIDIDISNVSATP